jgi:serine protease Do
MTVWRKGALRDLTLTIVELEPEKATGKQEKKPKAEQSANALGLVVTDLSAAQLKELNIESGVLVDTSEGVAARSGIRSGDVLLRVNNTDLKDARQFNALVAKLDTKKPVLLLVRRGDASQFVIVKPHGQ